MALALRFLAVLGLLMTVLVDESHAVIFGFSNLTCTAVRFSVQVTPAEYAAGKSATFYIRNEYDYTQYVNIELDMYQAGPIFKPNTTYTFDTHLRSGYVGGFPGGAQWRVGLALAFENGRHIPGYDVFADYVTSPCADPGARQPPFNTSTTWPVASLVPVDWDPNPAVDAYKDEGFGLPSGLIDAIPVVTSKASHMTAYIAGGAAGGAALLIAILATAFLLRRRRSIHNRRAGQGGDEEQGSEDPATDDAGEESVEKDDDASDRHAQQSNNDNDGNDATPETKEISNTDREALTQVQCLSHGDAPSTAHQAYETYETIAVTANDQSASPTGTAKWSDRFKLRRKEQKSENNDAGKLIVKKEGEGGTEQPAVPSSTTDDNMVVGEALERVVEEPKCDVLPEASPPPVQSQSAAAAPSRISRLFKRERRQADGDNQNATVVPAPTPIVAPTMLTAPTPVAAPVATFAPMMPFAAPLDTVPQMQAAAFIPFENRWTSTPSVPKPAAVLPASQPRGQHIPSGPLRANNPLLLSAETWKAAPVLETVAKPASLPREQSLPEPMAHR